MVGNIGVWFGEVFRSFSYGLLYLVIGLKGFRARVVCMVGFVGLFWSKVRRFFFFLFNRWGVRWFEGVVDRG